MKQHILPAIKLTFICIIVFVGFYTLLIWGIAQAAPGKGDGESISVNNKVIGYKLEGQSFTADKYFNTRPSAGGYHADASSGSNKGPSNPDYLKGVQALIDTFMVHNPSVNKEDIPSELVTASASGLDPDLSPEGALVQIPRIARARNISEGDITELVKRQIKNPLLGIFGPPKVNVLQLNIKLDELK
ncbi:MAG TPA: K(+)-transporting ATPase subunit C [Ginsengibacter sp.]